NRSGIRRGRARCVDPRRDRQLGSGRARPLLRARTRHLRRDGCMRPRATTESTGTTLTSPTTAAAPTRAASDYGQLLAQVQRAGLLERSAVRYVPRFLALGAAAGAG